MLGEIWIYCILGISWPRSPGWILGSMWIYIDLHDLVTRVRPIAVSRVAWNFCFTMAFSICQLSFIILFISIASIRVYYIYIYLFIYLFITMIGYPHSWWSNIHLLYHQPTCRCRSFHRSNRGHRQRWQRAQQKTWLFWGGNGATRAFFGTSHESFFWLVALGSEP